MLRPAVHLASAAGVIVLSIAIGVWSISFAGSVNGLSRATTSPAAPVLFVAAGASLVTAGVVGAWRRPRLTGARLLIAAGFGWFVAEWAGPGAPTALVFTVGLLLGTAWPAAIAHASVLLGRRTVDATVAALIAAGYAICVGVLGMVPALAFDPQASGCTGCPDNLVGSIGSAGLVSDATRAGLVLEAIWAAALAIVLGLRLGRGRRSARELAAAVQLPAFVSVGAVAMDGLHSVPRGALSNDPLDVSLWAISAVGLIGCAIGAMLPVVRARTARRAVVRIALEVADAPPFGELQRTLAGVLDDPALTISYPVDVDRSVDHMGNDIIGVIPTGPGRSVSTVTQDGVDVARIDHRADLAGEVGRVEDAVAASRLWLENERLHALQLARMVELRRSRAEIVAASDAERRRIERDLHDASQQQLVSLAFELTLAREAAAKAGDAGAEARLSTAEEHVRDALADLRELAHGIYPRALVDQGLEAALEDLAVSAEIPVSLSGGTTGGFDARIEAAAYHVAAEVVRTGVLARVHIHLSDSGGRLGMIIEGPGPGPSGALRFDLEDRVLALGGTLDIEGTDGRRRIGVELPCGS